METFPTRSHRHCQSLLLSSPNRGGHTHHRKTNEAPRARLGRLTELLHQLPRSPAWPGSLEGRGARASVSPAPPPLLLWSENKSGCQLGTRFSSVAVSYSPTMGSAPRPPRNWGAWPAPPGLGPLWDEGRVSSPHVFPPSCQPGVWLSGVLPARVQLGQCQACHLRL